MGLHGRNGNNILDATKEHPYLLWCMCHIILIKILGDKNVDGCVYADGLSLARWCLPPFYHILWSWIQMVEILMSLLPYFNIALANIKSFDYFGTYMHQWERIILCCYPTRWSWEINRGGTI